MDTLGYTHIREKGTGPESDLKTRLWYWSLQNRIPLHGGIELSQQCNFRCVHCFLEHRIEKTPLSTEKIIYYLDQITAAGTLWLTLTGGEPLLRRDFADIYKAAIDRGLLLLLFTNGSYLNESIVQLIAETPPVVVEVSIYGMSEKTYIAVTGQQDAFQRVKRNVEAAYTSGLPLFLKFIVIKDNLKDVDTFRRWARNMNIDYDISAPIHPGVYGSKDTLSHRVGAKDYVCIEMENPVFKRAWKNAINSPRKKNEDSHSLFRCNAGKNIYLISADGCVHPCVLYRKNLFSLNKESFDQIWDRMGKLSNLSRYKKLPCDSCSYREVCSVCPAWSSLEHEDPEVPLTFLCEAAKDCVNFLKKEKKNGKEKRTGSTSGSHERDSYVKRTPSNGWTGSQNRRQLLQKSPTVRACSKIREGITGNSKNLFVLKKELIRRRIGYWDLLIPRSREKKGKNQVISLNADASRILDSLSEPISASQLHEEISALGDSISLENMTRFLDQLVEIGAIDHIRES